jgi:hypothetical protein
MSELRLSDTEPAAFIVRYIPRGADSGYPTQQWFIIADYGWSEMVVAACDYPHHARAVASALAIVHAASLTGDLDDLALSS